MNDNWNNNFALNIPVIDQQHKKFFELFDKTMEAKDIDSPEQMEAIIRELEEYLKYHFQTEEKLMEESGFKNIEYHKNQHRLFIKRINEMKLELDYMNPLLFNKISVFI